MKPFTIILFCYFLATSGCHSQAPTQTITLTERDRQLCDSLKIDTSIALEVRLKTDSILSAFPANLENLLDKDIDPGPRRFNVQGLIFNAVNTSADDIAINLYKKFQGKGYTIFFLDRSYGIDNKPDIMGILKTVDKYQILRQVQTDGINWDIDNDSLLSIVKRFDKKYALDLIAASDDWCEFIIRKEPQNWLTLAKEAYKVCPDIVDQGTETVENLAEEMKRTKRLYFWWD